MRTLFSFWLAILSVSASAQYFYTDILSTENNRTHYRLLIKQQVKKVSVKAYDGAGELIDDFRLIQQVDADKRTLTTYSKTNLSDGSILQTTYNSAGRVIAVLDSSDGASVNTKYRYDAQGRLQVLESVAIQSEQKENIVSEKRMYRYDEKGMPVQMLRIKGQSDTLVVTFVAAENGLPGEEIWTRDGKKIETWYYYYDDKQQLTDIVRFNNAAGKMLPDYLFAYDENGNLTTRVTVQTGTGQYRTWQYRYNSAGLKVAEVVLNKKKEQEGRLEYSYQ